MSEQGLFDPIVDFVLKRVGKNVTAIFIAVLVVACVGHLDGTGASTYLITIPAFKPIMDRLKVKPTSFLGTIIAMMAVMNIIPWGGPTLRAASVAQVEVYDLYSFIFPAVGAMMLIAIGIAVIVYIAAVVVLKIFSKDELFMIPYGTKICKVLEKLKIY